jgi:hypothetical protein
MDTDVTFCFSLQKTIAFLNSICELFSRLQTAIHKD